MKTFITKRQAIKILRESTGLSIATVEATVRNMPTVKDRCRDKVSMKDLHATIAKLTAPPKPHKTSIRPISEKQKARVREAAAHRRADAITSDVVERVMSRFTR